MGEVVGTQQGWTIEEGRISNDVAPRSPRYINDCSGEGVVIGWQGAESHGRDGTEERTGCSGSGTRWHEGRHAGRTRGSRWAAGRVRSGARAACGACADNMHL